MGWEKIRGIVRRVVGGRREVEASIRHKYLRRQWSAVVRTRAHFIIRRSGRQSVSHRACAISIKLGDLGSLSPTPFDHGWDHDRESKWGIKRIPLVARYLLRAAHLSSCLTPFSSSGQNSTPSWNISLPQTCSSPSFPDSCCLLKLNRLHLSEEWPHLREMIKYKIQKVR